MEAERTFFSTPKVLWRHSPGGGVYVISGEEKGPTLLIIAGIHGDESGGYLTAERYADVKVKKGTLIIVPRLNLPAVVKGKRQGLSGDMNRLFHLPEDTYTTPDTKVVNLAKSLIKRADYVLNLHQGEGFYSPKWISHKRNPFRWGQCNVIDAPIFDLPNGDKLELASFAKKIASSSNSKIKDQKYHFQVNNTNTASSKSIHKEQRRSLTYYALYQQHKTALALESTKNCTVPQAVGFLTIAINSVIGEVGFKQKIFLPQILSQSARSSLKKNLKRNLFRPPLTISHILLNLCNPYLEGLSFESFLEITFIIDISISLSYI
ncbi:MAG: M14/M99 family metallopeptidase [Syntrophales bacterium]